MPKVEYSIVPSVRPVVEMVTKSLDSQYSFPADIVEICEAEVRARIPWQFWGVPENDFIDCLVGILEDRKIGKHA